jgi:hypothetical protein
MATKGRAPGKPKEKSRGAGADNKLESNQRMVWIEQGGLDLREAMAKRQTAKRQRSR